MKRTLEYCWWTKSCTTKDDDYPIIYRVLSFNHPKWCRISSINSITFHFTCFRHVSRSLWRILRQSTLFSCGDDWWSPGCSLSLQHTMDLSTWVGASYFKSNLRFHIPKGLFKPPFGIIALSTNQNPSMFFLQKYLLEKPSISANIAIETPVRICFSQKWNQGCWRRNPRSPNSRRINSSQSQKGKMDDSRHFANGWSWFSRKAPGNTHIHKICWTRCTVSVIYHYIKSLQYWYVLRLAQKTPWFVGISNFFNNPSDFFGITNLDNKNT